MAAASSRQVVGECVVSHRPKETFRWTTPFFDLHFVEIKSKRRPSPSVKHRRKSSHSRERVSPSNSSNEIRYGGHRQKIMSTNQPPGGGPPIGPSTASISERRMAKYKEERRRQLANQIAHRLSSNHSSSSSDENEESNSSLEKYAKYRRHHRSRAGGASQGSAEALATAETPPVAVTRRRRRRSITKDNASPSNNTPTPNMVTSSNPVGGHSSTAATVVKAGKNVATTHVDADGEDNGVDREDSPEHIYHQIGTSEVIRVSKSSPLRSTERHNSLDNDPIIITKHSASRKPRFPSKEREAKSSDPASSSLRSGAIPRLPATPTQQHKITALDNITGDRKETSSTKKSLLNTSYSSEEILLQAASSLQGLEDEFRNSSQYALKHQPAKLGLKQCSLDESASSSRIKALSSPEMIKSVSRTLTPPISPIHNQRLTSALPSAETSRVSPPSSIASSVASNSVPISDPFIDTNWPGRPKRNSLGESIEASKKAASGRQVSTPSPGTASKPPIFPVTSPKISSNDQEMPPFMKEFVMRRNSDKKSSVSPNANARPQSAFISSPSKKVQVDPTRRRSDFVSRYESLLSRAQNATKAVDELDLLRLQRSAAKVNVNNAEAELVDEEEDETSVDFNEEEVLQRCQDFQKDYQQRKLQQTPPIPKPRSFIQGKPINAPDEVPKPSLRTRSSSLTLHDKNEHEGSVASAMVSKKNSVQEPPVSSTSSATNTSVFPKPILKKSSDDISRSLENHRPILKRKDSESSIVTNESNANSANIGSTSGASSLTTTMTTTSGILKRKSVIDDLTVMTSSRPEHVRIRSPSPDLDCVRPSILVRSRNSSLCEDEFPQSILKKRSNSQEDLIMDGDISASAGTSGATSRSSPEPPVHGILKRKLSLGNASPDQSIAGAISSILKKSGASSSGQGSLEDLTSGSADGIKSILKKRHHFTTNPSTDDELDQEEQVQQQQPRSILKSRRSEESLSPLSDDCVLPLPASNAAIEDNIKPILKQRDSSRDEGYHSSKLRDKSRSPSRGTVTSPPDNMNDVLFSGSSGVSTPMSSSNRRSSLTFSPKRSSVDESGESPLRKSSFVSKTTVFLEPRLDLNELKMMENQSSTSLPTSPTQDHEPIIANPGILKRKGSIQGTATSASKSADSCLEVSAVASTADSATASGGNGNALRHHHRRGVLKKDSSYDDTLRPILKNHAEQFISASNTVMPSSTTSMNDSNVSSTSSEDLENLIDANNRGFVDVVIDPIPAPSEDFHHHEPIQVIQPSPRKSSLGPRLPVIPPSSVKITPDGNLACKLEALSGQAEAKLKQMAAEEEQLRRTSSSTTPEKSLRKASQDLPASEYYAIYQQTKKLSAGSCQLPTACTNEEVIIGEAEDDTTPIIMEKTEVKVQGGGIAERLAALKKNGEENWKKKVNKIEPPATQPAVQQKKFIEDNNGNESNGNSSAINQDNELITLRTKPTNKVGSLQQRMSQLQESQKTWQNKVGDKDVDKFTVAGKMSSSTRMSRRSESELNELNQVQNRVKKTPKLRKFQSSPPPANDRSYDDLQEANDHFEANYVAVEVPELDQDLDKFFASCKDVKKEEQVLLDPDFDLDFLETTSERPLNLKKNVVRKPVKSKTKSSRNPVKALANRADVKANYNEKTQVTMTTLEALRTEKNDVHSHLAAEAKAALAATEDFATVQLKKDNKVVPHAEFVPYKAPGETMLLHVKGRRMCQTRLVNPHPSSVNSGDAYVLINGKDVIVWQGTFSNVIEKSKSADLGQMIVQRRDLGCKKAHRVLLVEEEKVSEANMTNKLFWKLLGSSSSEKPGKAGNPQEDEDFEIEINDQNLVWRVEEDTNELIPIEEYWGMPLKHDLLTNDRQVLVFDFTNELYVWNGKNAPFSKRRLGLKLAKDMLAGLERPAWTLFGRINENMETILFKEKFLNWPDASRLIKPDSSADKNKAKNNANADDLKLSTDIENNFDAIDMSRWPLQEPNEQMEGTCLGRGRSYYDAPERRQYEIDTLSINFWHVTDKDIFELNEDEHGQFYSAGTFVVRWKYKVSLTGRDLKGRPSKHVAVGRERWAYFFWQGRDSKAAEQGISALMTVELDEEKGPQIRVEQGHETALFLNLWKGAMVVHKGRKSGKVLSPEWRLYFVKGECPEEACAVQVDCQGSSLRSRACFILIQGSSKAIIWMGQGLPEHKKDVVEALKKKWRHLAAVKNISHEVEGQESDAFKEAVNLGNEQFHRGLQAPKASIRLYHMTSASGEFYVNEMVCPYLNQDVANVLSFNQSDLYKVEQPALFLIESGDEKLWLWQGWWPDVGHEANDTNMTTGSGMIRWHAERREAMRTIKEFQRSKFSRLNSSARPAMELVWAGHEPMEFTNLFPAWTHHEDVYNLNAKFVGNTSLDRTFALLSRDNYSWEELKQRPLPDGVDPSRLEKYLSEEDFMTHLGLSRETFMAAPRWKQLEIRKEKGLF